MQFFHHRDFRASETPLSQLSHRLSPAAESGDVARSLGFLPARQHRPPQPRQVSPASVCFTWPSPSRHHPHRGDRGQTA